MRENRRWTPVSVTSSSALSKMSDMNGALLTVYPSRLVFWKLRSKRFWRAWSRKLCVLLFPMIRAVLCTQPAITTGRLTE